MVWKRLLRKAQGAPDQMGRERPLLVAASRLCLNFESLSCWAFVELLQTLVLRVVQKRLLEMEP
jgi:hypothetical protein